jgi:hypothetical protein
MVRSVRTGVTTWHATCDGLALTRDRRDRTVQGHWIVSSLPGLAASVPPFLHGGLSPVLTSFQATSEISPNRRARLKGS